MLVPNNKPWRTNNLYNMLYIKTMVIIIIEVYIAYNMIMGTLLGIRKKTMLEKNTFSCKYIIS